MGLRSWLLSTLCGILPDLDAIGYFLGVRYGSLWGHRGITHSILFAAAVGGLATELAFPEVPSFSGRWLHLAITFFLATISHALLDAITNGGHGVALLAPFNQRRYFFRWRPVLVSPMGVRAFFSNWGARVMVSELQWIWLPLGLIAVASWVVR
jgi:inner membrane protein